ncbi:hypothetical protein BDP27DRAFT_1330978, partial [Rhodocollybia butyracea]
FFPSSMTPGEQQLLSTYAQNMFFNSINFIVSVVPGAFVLGFIIAVRSLMTTERRGRSQTALVVCLTTIFICFTLFVSYQGGVSLTSTWYTLVRVSEEGFATQVQAANEKTTTWQFMSSWGTTISVLLSDGTVVWRAWCLFQGNKLWKLTLVILMILNVCINVADCIWLDIKLSLRSSDAKPTILDWLSAVLPLIVNMVTTILSILNLLIESGAIFCAIQTTYIIALVLGTYGVITSWVLAAVESVFAIASACHPVAIIALVSMIPADDTHYSKQRLETD